MESKVFFFFLWVKTWDPKTFASFSPLWSSASTSQGSINFTSSSETVKVPVLFFFFKKLTSSWTSTSGLVFILSNTSLLCKLLDFTLVLDFSLPILASFPLSFYLFCLSLSTHFLFFILFPFIFLSCLSYGFLWVLSILWTPIAIHIALWSEILGFFFFSG